MSPSKRRGVQRICGSSPNCKLSKRCVVHRLRTEHEERKGTPQGANPPNIALEPTASSLRSYVAAASSGGSPRALGDILRSGWKGGDGERNVEIVLTYVSCFEAKRSKAKIMEVYYGEESDSASIARQPLGNGKPSQRRFKVRGRSATLRAGGSSCNVGWPSS